MELCPHCGALLPEGSQQCPLCQTPETLVEQSRLDQPGQNDAGTDLEVIAPGSVAAGPLSIGLERWLARPGGRRQARVALSLVLVAALLVVSVAAWWTFVHSIWGARLSGIDQIIFVGSQSQQGTSYTTSACLTVTDPSGTVSDCSAYPNASKFPADPSASFSPGQLYVIRPDGSGVRQLTSAPNVSYLSPAWSPDGSRIATFVISASSGVAAQLELMDATGANAEMIPSVSLFPDGLNPVDGKGNTVFSRLIEWSPNGSQLIALLGERQFGLIQDDGTNLRIFVGSKPAWSPDGRYVAYFVYDAAAPVPPGYAPPEAIKIEILDTQTFQTRQLENIPTPGGQALAWSPDGQYLAYDASEGGDYQTAPTDALMLVRPDGSQPQLIGQWNGEAIEQIAWSPDSRQLAAVLESLISYAPGVWQYSTPELWVVNADGSNLRDLAPSDSEQPSWAPDGHRLVFASSDDAALLVADTTAQPKATIQRMTAGMPTLFAPCWSPLAGV